MPPHIPRPSICGGIQSALSSSSRAGTSSPSSLLSRFSTTTPKRQTTIPPESPKYIKIPEPPQSSEIKLPPIRGHLPVPRQVFPKREGDRKIRPGYVEAATPKSAAELAGKPPLTEHEARHRRMAESRRQSLAAGLQGLYDRKQQKDKQAAARNRSRAESARALAFAPERLDDVLTRPTVRASTSQNTTVILSPRRFEKAEAARQGHAAMLAAKSEARRDALAQLYVAAGNFIVDEAELEKQVAKLFTEDAHSHESVHGGNSIWQAKGAPVTTGLLRARMGSGMGRSGLDNEINKSEISQQMAQRQKTVAEELTGGRL
ncbi:hypothetical protein B0H66DRAFT_542674 [Apodospora peruviana]|uniref:Uncharacterized protein n=1 Tax=Apodospora peruviana TaxID=516989 RepID=A0AAE0MGF2_9PEZI|nr:hypothetical protein B0H66DRAFT_542674 [Apodospora peruviana]